MALQPYEGEIQPQEDRMRGLKPYSGDLKPLDYEPPDQNRTLLQDIGTDLKRSVQQLPGMFSSLVDIPVAAITGDRYVSKAADALGEATGFQPGKWSEEARQEYSPERQAGSAEIDKAWGDGGAANIAGAYIRNPGNIAGLVAESLPSMVAGGLAGRAALTAGRAAGVIAAPATAAQAARQGLIAGAGGEGAVIAGQTMDQIDDSVDARRAAAAATGAGTLGALVGYGGGRIAQRMGVIDVDTALAGGRAAVADASGAPAQGLVRRMLGGALAEGAFQELPQSMQEQMWRNWAEGRPVMEGVARAAVEGTLAGMAMGAGANVVSPGRGTPQADPAAGQAPDDTTRPPPQPASGPLRKRDFEAALREEVEPQIIIDENGRPKSSTSKYEIDLFHAEIDARIAKRQQNIEAGKRLQDARRPSEQMGLDPNAGTMSAAAALAVDSGASQQFGEQVMQQEAEALPNEHKGEQTPRERDYVPPPAGSFSDMNDFAELLGQERHDVEGRRQQIGDMQTQRQAFEFEEADRRTAQGMQREAQARRRAVLDAVLEDPETVNPAERFAATLQRTGFRDAAPTEDELATIQRFEDVRAAQPSAPQIEPSAPNELDAASMGIRERQPPAAPEPIEAVGDRWDTLAPAQRAAMLNEAGGWNARNGSLNVIGKNLAGKAWSSIPEGVRSKVTQLLQAAPRADAVVPAAQPQGVYDGAIPTDDMPDAAVAAPGAAQAGDYMGPSAGAASQQFDVPAAGGMEPAAASVVGGRVPGESAGVESAGRAAVAPGDGSPAGQALRILIERTDGNGSPDGLAGPENADARTAIVAAITGQSIAEIEAAPNYKFRTSVPQVERLLYDAAGIPAGNLKDRRAPFLDWLDAQTGQQAPAQGKESAEPFSEEGDQGPQFSRAGQNADEFVQAPDGSIDFGEITAEMASTMRRQAGKIRLERGDDSYGERHIELRHGDDIRRLGFDGIASFVADIAGNINQVWRPVKSAQLVAIHEVSNDRVMFVELRVARDETGDYYTVRSAFPARKGFIKNKGWELLWEDGRAQPSTNASSSAPFAVPTPNSAGESATIPSGQSSEESLAQTVGARDATAPAPAPIKSDKPANSLAARVDDDTGFTEIARSYRARGITPDTLREAIAGQFPSLSRGLERMLERGQKGEKGGLVVIDSTHERDIAEVFAQKTRRPLDEVVRYFSDAEGINGFFDPRSGITFMVGPNLTAQTAPAVLLHEMVHSQQRANIDARSMAMIEGRGKNVVRPMRELLNRVADRMARAGESGNASEATAYIVEEAVLLGRQAGFSVVDGPFMDFVDARISRRIGDILRDVVAMVRAWALRHGAGIVRLTVDDLVAYAKVGVERAGRGDVQTTGDGAARSISDGEVRTPSNEPRHGEGGSTRIAPVRLELKGWSGSASDLSALARQVYTDELQGSTVDNASLGGPVTFSAEGKGEAFGARGKLRSPVRAELVRVLREVVGTAVKVAEAPPQKGREADTRAFHTLVAPLSVNGELHSVKVTVREALRVPDGDAAHKFYDVTTVQIRRSPGVHGVDDAEASSRPAPSEASDVMVADLARAFNLDVQFSRAGPAQKILDAGDAAVAKLDGWLDRRTRVPDEWSPQQKAAASKFATFSPKQPVKSMLRGISNRMKDRAAQLIFDQFRPLRNISETAFIQAHLSKATDGALEAVATLGLPVLRDGALAVEKQDGGGFLNDLAKNLGSAQEVNQCLMWIAGNRAEKLMAEGRENLFSRDDIPAMKAFNQGRLADGRPRVVAYAQMQARLNAYNKAVLDIAEQAGLINTEARRGWESEFYIPFYRVSEESGEMDFSAGGTGLARQKVIQKLKGGTENLGDPLANIMANWHMMLTASMRNMAANAALKQGQSLGIAERVAAPSLAVPASRGGTWTMENGQKVLWQVDDPMVVEALEALNFNGYNNPAMRAAGKFKRLLTIGVTISPTFRIRNFVRDTMQALATADVGYNPLKNAVAGWELTGKDSDTMAQLMAGGGAVRFGSFNDGQQAEYAKRLIAMGVKDNQILDTPDKLKNFFRRFYDRYQETGDRAETINRAVIYQRVLAETGDHLKASFAARDLMNFTSLGSSAAIRALAQVLPFFNARLQGMDRLVRGAAADPRRFWSVAGVIGMGSALLYLLQGDDDEYKALPDYVRNTYWPVKIGGVWAYVPKPFEVGALGTVVERFTELMVAGNDYQARDFRDSMVGILANTLAMNPVPQIVKPIGEAWFNYDMFRGQQIDSMSMQRLLPEERFNANTSAAAVGAGRALGVSPQKLEHLVRGYFGWLGIQALNVGDLMARPFMDMPASPRRDLSSVNNWLVAGDLFKEVGTTPSKYSERFYRVQREISAIYATASQARNLDNMDQYRELMSRPEMAARPMLVHADRQMTRINQQMRAIMADRGMNVVQKNLRLRELRARRDEIARRVDERARAA